MNDNTRPLHPHQGLIATHNPELFQQLFDSPSASPKMGDSGNRAVNKFYVEGAEGDHFTEQDEDKYKFISDDIEDFDEKQYSMLVDSSRKEGNSRGRSQTGGSPHRKEYSKKEYKTYAEAIPVVPRAPLKQKTQFVLKEPRYMTEEERDLEELRREERYQAKLRQKLQDMEQNVSQKQNVFIPKLDLRDSDDEEKVKKKSSEPLDISLRDSLDDEPTRAAPVSVAPQNDYSPQHRGSVVERETIEDQPEHDIGVQDSLEFNPQSGHVIGGYQHQPGVHGNDPLSRVFHPEDIPAARNEERNRPWDQNQGLDNTMTNRFQDMNISAQQNQHYNPNEAYNVDGNNGADFDQNDQQHEHYSSENLQGNNDTNTTQTHQERFDNLRRKHNEKLSAQTGSNVRRVNSLKKREKENLERLEQGVDFVEKNKQVARARKKEGKSYSALHAKKKEPESQIPGPIKPSSAEHVWDKRNISNEEAHMYNSPQTWGPQRAPGYAPLRKYPSESRVDEMKIQRAQVVPPHRVGPMPPRAAPIEAFQDHAQTAGWTGTHPNQNIQHPQHAGYAYGQDGQRYDFDVNIKSSSPSQPDLQPYMTDAPPQPYAQDAYYAQDPETQYNHQGPQGPQGHQGPQGPQGHQGYYGAPSYDAHGYNYPHHGNQQPPHHYGQAYNDYGPQMTQQYNYRQPYYPVQQEEWSNPSNRGSYRGSITTTERSQTPGSPYKILPPISGDDAQEIPRRDKASPRRGDVSPGREEGSYMEAFRSKKNKKIEYKKYTINDYRKLNMEVHRGGLGPETDGAEHRSRREKAQRQQEYARMIAEKNRQEMEVAKARPEVMRRPEEDNYDEVYQRHIMAKEYAKSVPKPKPRSKPPSGAPYSGSSNRSNNTDNNNSNQGGKPSPPSGHSRREQSPLVEMVDLEALQKRHEEEKMKAEMIRQNVQGVH